VVGSRHFHVAFHVDDSMPSASPISVQSALPASSFSAAAFSAWAS